MAKEKALGHGDRVRNTKTGEDGRLIDVYKDGDRYGVLPDIGPGHVVLWYRDQTERA